MNKQQPICDLHLTDGYADPELARQIRSTWPGMAHFAASGPLGATCGQCAFFGYWHTVTNKKGRCQSVYHSNRCAKFRDLTGKRGDPIAPYIESCKYFTRDVD
jgi:hypothetical protein